MFNRKAIDSTHQTKGSFLPFLNLKTTSQLVFSVFFLRHKTDIFYIPAVNFIRSLVVPQILSF